MFVCLQAGANSVSVHKRRHIIIIIFKHPLLQKCIHVGDAKASPGWLQWKCVIVFDLWTEWMQNKQDTNELRHELELKVSSWWKPLMHLYWNLSCYTLGCVYCTQIQVCFAGKTHCSFILNKNAFKDICIFLSFLFWMFIPYVVPSVTFSIDVRVIAEWGRAERACALSCSLQAIQGQSKWPSGQI